MKTLQEQHSNAIRIVARTCLMTGLVTLGGCAFLDDVTTRTIPDNRVQLAWQDGALSLYRQELPDYTCVDGQMLQCVHNGVKYSCQCPRY
jgi:hypothetical protein